MRRVLSILAARARAVGWLAILAGCEVLLQWHGWAFWMENFDRRIGWAVPVVLAALAAALWWRAARSSGPHAWAWIALAAATSIILLAGPVLQVIEQPLTAWHAAQTLPRQAEAAEQDLAAKRHELRGYLGITAQGRYGWFGVIQSTRSELERLERRRDSLLVQSPAPTWRIWLVMGLQVAVLLLLQTGAALAAVWYARDWPPPPTQMPALVPRIRAPVVPATPATTGATDQLVARLQRTIKDAADVAQLTVTAWGKTKGIDKRDTSNLFSYFAHKASGTRTISDAKLKEMETLILTCQERQGPS